MRPATAALAALSVVGLVACKKDEEKKDEPNPPRAAFLTPQALMSASGLTKLDKEKAKKEMGDLSALWHEKPDDDDESGLASSVAADDEESSDSAGLSVCMDRVLAKQLVLHASGDTLSYGIDFDARRDCSADDMAAANTSSASIDRFAFLAYARFRCDGADFSSLDGKSLAEAGSSAVGTLCAETGAHEMLSNSRTTMDFTIFGVRIQGTTESSTSRPDGSACRYDLKDGLATTDGCAAINRAASHSDGGTVQGTKIEAQDSTILAVVTYENVGYKGSKDPHFSSGKAAIKLNDWTGEIVYKGANVAPTWTMKSGSETLTGTLGGTTTPSPTTTTPPPATGTQTGTTTGTGTGTGTSTAGDDQGIPLETGTPLLGRLPTPGALNGLLRLPFKG